MKSTPVLPDGYKEICSIDLQKDMKLAVIVNAIALVIAAIMIVPLTFFVPISYLFNLENTSSTLLKLGVIVALVAVYMVLHELVHGIAMKMCGTKKVKYGFTGMYAFAGSDDYYAKAPYIFIALAPVVLWGAVIAVVNCFVSLEWFWVVYFIQIMNLSGAAGDLFVTVKFLRMPKDILVSDSGVSMTVYSKE